MFCPRCGNKIAAGTKVCAHCHYNEDTKNIDANANVIDVTPKDKKQKRVKKEAVKSSPSFLLSYISYVLILLSIAGSMAIYWIYNLSMEYYTSIGVCAFIILLGGSIYAKSSSNINKVKMNSKTFIMLSLILILFSLAIMITNYFYTITDINLNIETMYMLALTLGGLLLILGLELYLISGNK